jgi:hypothetical protein
MGIFVLMTTGFRQDGKSISSEWLEILVEQRGLSP